MEIGRIVFNQVLVMTLLIGVGILLYKIRLISRQTNLQLTNLVQYVVNPLLVLSSFSMEYSRDYIHNFIIGLLAASLFHALAILISHIARLGANRHLLPVERFGIIFTNSGFMAAPIMLSLYGNLGLFYNNTCVIAFQLFVWTYGISLMSDDNHGGIRQKIRLFINPMIICVFLGMAMYLMRLTFPSPIRKSIEFIAGMNTPLAMIVSGIYLAQSNLLSLFRKPRVLRISCIRMILFPLVVIALLVPLHLDQTLTYSLVIAMSVPMASSVIFFSKNSEKRTEHASDLFTLSTILGLVTIPCMITLTSKLCSLLY